MKTWEDYKAHVRTSDTVISRDIDKIEAEAKILGSVICSKENPKQ